MPSPPHPKDPLAGLLAPGEYQRFRARLIRYFEWNGCWDPEELADETVFRAVKAVSGGTPVFGPDVCHFLWGIAANVLKEARRRPRLPDQPEDVPGPDPSRQVEIRIALAECLSRLSPHERRLLVRSCSEPPGRLASELGLTVTNFRVRLHRIRNKLRDFMEAK